MKYILLLFCFSLHATDFSVQNLGTLKKEKSIGSTINNNNIVSGKFTDKNNKPVDFLWEQSKGLTGLPYEATDYQAPLINNNDEVAGIFWSKTNNWFYANQKSKHLYIRSANGSFQDIGVPPGWESQSVPEKENTRLYDDKKLAIIGFNDQGQILVADKAEAATKYAIWQSGYFTEIKLSRAYGLNNQGEILGQKSNKLVLYNFANNTTREIVKETGIRFKQLNDQNQVAIVQRVEYGFASETFAYLWDEQNGLMPLNDFYPMLMNNQNQMVGIQIINKKPEPCFYDNGSLVSMSQDFKKYDIRSLVALNDNGQILAQGLVDYKQHAFVLVPE